MKNECDTRPTSNKLTSTTGTSKDQDSDYFTENFQVKENKT